MGIVYRVDLTVAAFSYLPLVGAVSVATAVRQTVSKMINFRSWISIS